MSNHQLSSTLLCNLALALTLTLSVGAAGCAQVEPTEAKGATTSRMDEGGGDEGGGDEGGGDEGGGDEGGGDEGGGDEGGDLLVDVRGDGMGPGQGGRQQGPDGPGQLGDRDPRGVGQSDWDRGEQGNPFQVNEDPRGAAQDPAERGPGRIDDDLRSPLQDRAREEPAPDAPCRIFTGGCR